MVWCSFPKELRAIITSTVLSAEKGIVWCEGSSVGKKWWRWWWRLAADEVGEGVIVCGGGAVSCGLSHRGWDGAGSKLWKGKLGKEGVIYTLGMVQKSRTIGSIRFPVIMAVSTMIMVAFNTRSEDAEGGLTTWCCCSQAGQLMASRSEWAGWDWVEFVALGPASPGRSAMSHLQSRHVRT